jgi:hypothetical protein
VQLFLVVGTFVNHSYFFGTSVSAADLPLGALEILQKVETQSLNLCFLLCIQIFCYSIQ